MENRDRCIPRRQVGELPGAYSMQPIDLCTIMERLVLLYWGLCLARLLRGRQAANGSAALTERKSLATLLSIGGLAEHR